MTFPSASLGVESAMSLDATPCGLGSALVQNVRGANANHVSESIDKIQLLQNIKSNDQRY
jgi:UDP-N-acetylenolpyruvoylglucosamine reductase